MNPSREEALFALALEKATDKRAVFVEAVCAIALWDLHTVDQTLVRLGLNP